MSNVFSITDISKKVEAYDDLMDSLLVSSLKANFLDMVVSYGIEEANVRMPRLFKESWESRKEVVWQWFDIEMNELRERS
tara:strand:+ start:309 stop:548 length:240 start_codon:yes stop_codon:yes gene_type:complete